MVLSSTDVYSFKVLSFAHRDVWSGVKDSSLRRRQWTGERVSEEVEDRENVK